MSEYDLGLKVRSRRLLWRMGFTTRIDVPLRTYVPQPANAGRGSKYETFTDLDVLGITLTPAFSVCSLIADCKTSARGSTERMFWVRGVSDLFAAEEAWMVRSGPVTAASRQLADRLRITVLEPPDLAQLEEFYPSSMALDAGPIAPLFTESAVAASMKTLNSLDKNLDRLIQYRQFDYWVFDEHRNLQQLVAHLAFVSKTLDPAQPAHRAVFLDCCWLYCLSLAHAISYVRAVHVSDVDTALQQYMFGGQLGLQEKRKLAAMLARFAPEGAIPAGGDGTLPHWYPQLRELLVRHLRRPMVMNDELRYAEWGAAAQLARVTVRASEAFMGDFNPIAAKLLVDVCGFLVSAGRLDPRFREFGQGLFSQLAAQTSQQSSV